jgi:penicillin-binding protein 1A
VPELASYQPRTVSTFYADDGTVIGVFYNQKRFVVDLEQIPQHVINAFLAAEDSRFYEHPGVDWQGIARALVQNLRAGKIIQGGSTITMQVTRNFLLTRERRFSRKIREMLLASKLERLWGKKKILHIYLNEIYLGEGCYGVEAAARAYFGKPVEHLNVAEAALIAGLVASPARFNPFKSEELARQRQATVLTRMLKAQFITQAEYDHAKDLKLVFRRETIRPFDLVPDFAEAVRRHIVKEYGAEKLYNEGLKVFTTCRVDYQHKALEAMAKGLKEIRGRQKNLAILKTLSREEVSEILQKRRTPNLTEGKIYQGVVVKINRGREVTDLHVLLSRQLKGIVRLRTAQATPYNVGQVLALRFANFVDESPFFTLDDDPQLQGALICIENNTGYVRALVGGSTGEHFKFNRALQALRQPGSAFKPFIYSAAIEKKSYSPATIIIDEPIIVDLGDSQEQEWEPRNAGGEFLGPVSARTALELSRNICTIKVLMDVGFDPVITTARKMGITAELGRNLSLSLGTSEMSLLEITAAYTVFPNGGVYVEPVLVKRIEDRFGNVLEDNTRLPVLEASRIPKPVPREEIQNLAGTRVQEEELDDETATADAETETMNPPSSDHQGPASQDGQRSTRKVRAAMSPQTAYVMTSMLQGGLVRGTGAGVRRILGRKDLAGKTGTTNNAEDTWFIGFNPQFTTGVWVGYDEKRPIGKREAGGRAALPIWAYFMKDILANAPEREFPVPPDIVFEEMPTYVGNPKDGFVPGMVTEPVYALLAGLTLVMCPLDPPESLQEYRPAELAYPYYGSSTPNSFPSPQAGPYFPGQGAVYPSQPMPATPYYPGDQRNLLPQQIQPGARQPAPVAPTRPLPSAGMNQWRAPGWPPGQDFANPAEAPRRPQAQPPGATYPAQPEPYRPTAGVPELPNLEQSPELRPYYPQRR